MGIVKNVRATACHAIGSMALHSAEVIGPIQCPSLQLKAVSWQVAICSGSYSQKGRGSRHTHGLAKAVCGTPPADPLMAGQERCDTLPGNKTYIIGSSDESEDVHLRVRLHVIAEQGVQVRNGRQRAVFVGHTV